MTAKLFRRQLVPLIILIALCAGTSDGAQRASPGSAGECSETAPLIRRLRSLNQRKRERAKKSILVFAGQSPGLRQCVISALKKIVDDGIAAGFVFAFKSPERYGQLVEATDLLGTMKAVEAMDSLIDGLDYNNGAVGLGIGHYPATKAIVKFGDLAVPKLEAALQKKPPGIRAMAAHALHAIGGEQAKGILIKALQTEKDESVSDTIRNMLLSWNVSDPRKT